MPLAYQQKHGELAAGESKSNLRLINVTMVLACPLTQTSKQSSQPHKDVQWKKCMYAYSNRVRVVFWLGVVFCTFSTPTSGGEK